MTVNFPRTKTRQQGQDRRRFQQQQFGGGQNSDTPATKIGMSDLALLRNAVSYNGYFEGHYGIQLDSDERDPGSGTRHSLEQHPVTGRWLFHRGNDLWISEGREQNRWTLLATLGADGSLDATGTFRDGSWTIAGDAAPFVYDLALAGYPDGDVTYDINIVDVDGVSFTIQLLSGATVIASDTNTYAATPGTLILSAVGGSGVSGLIQANAILPGDTPITGTATLNSTEVQFSLHGLTLDNTDAYELWWKVVVFGADITITLYKDAAMTEAVGSGSGTSGGLNVYISPENSSGITGYASAPSALDGTFSGSVLAFTAPSVNIDGASSADPVSDTGFMLFARSIVSRNIYIDQQIGRYWFMSERGAYGYYPIQPVSTGTNSEYRYLYTLCRIVDGNGEPAYSSNRVSANLKFEGPSPSVSPSTTDYMLASTGAPISEADPLSLDLSGTISGIPLNQSAPAYITHISIYRTTSTKTATTNTEQYIWVGDAPIYSETFSDTVSDVVLLARLEAGSTSIIPYIYALPSRGWREMDRGIGAVRSDFMFTAFPDTASASYCDVGVIPRLIGFFNPQQRRVLQDPVSHFITTQELMVIVCPSSAYALTTGINQDVGGGLYYIPIISDFRRVSGNVGVASRYKLFRVDDSSFIGYCTDHTIRVFSAMAWGNPFDGDKVHKILERALGDAKVGFIRGAIFFWFMDGDRARCLRYGTGGNTGTGWSELERTGWVYPDLVSTQETDEALLRLTALGATDGVFYAIENEAPDRIYDDEVAEDWPALRGAGADQLSDLVIAGWNGAPLYGRLLDGYFKLYGSQADADADANVMGMSDFLDAPAVLVAFGGVVNGTVTVLDIANVFFTVINGVHVGALLPIPSPVRYRDLTATVEAFICEHIESHVYMRFPYGMPAPLVKAKWYGDGVLMDSSNQVPEDGDIQSYRLVKGRRIQLELEMQSSGWQITAVDTLYQTQDRRSVNGPWDSDEAAIQRELASDMISWVNAVSSVVNRADTRRPKQNYQGVTPARVAGPFIGKYGQDFTEQDTFAMVREITAYTIMLWGKDLTGTPSAMIEDGTPTAYIRFPDANTIDIGSFQYPLPQPADDGFWHHYAVTRDQDWFRVYQDGIEVGANQLSPGSVIALASLTLGPAMLYDPRTYSVARSGTAIAYYVAHPEQLP